jgi:hypothetical protein
MAEMIRSLVALVRRLAYPSPMFRRFLIFLLIALLPLQGIASSFVVKCEAMGGGATLLTEEVPCHEMAPMSEAMDSTMNSEVPCHDHGDDGVLSGSSLDQGCCHHLVVAIPQIFSLPGTDLVRGQRYAAIAASFTDHLPDRLQRPPLSIVI